MPGSNFSNPVSQITVNLGSAAEVQITHDTSLEPETGESGAGSRDLLDYFIPAATGGAKPGFARPRSTGGSWSIICPQSA